MKYTDGLNSSLSYQAHIGLISASQLLWVHSGYPTANCRAIDIHGNIVPSDCALELLPLCAQSAPVSTQANNTATGCYQIQPPAPKHLREGSCYC